MTQSYSSSISENSSNGDGREPHQKAREIISKGLKRVYGSVDFRHDEINRLYASGMLLKQIAVKLGMADHTGVLYHLHGKCRCEKRNSYRFRQEIINKAKMWDTLKAGIEGHPLFEVMEIMEMELS